MLSKDKDELPDLLRDLQKRGDGYLSPGEDYFVNLASKSIQPPLKTNRVVPMRRWWLAAAVAVLLAIGSWAMLNDPQDLPGETATVSSPTSEELLAEISPEVIEAYIGNRLYDFETELYSSTQEIE